MTATATPGARRGHRNHTSALDDVPVALPALSRAQKIQKRAARVGFDWPDSSGPREKIDEELAELERARATGEATSIEEEFGDVLFSVVNLGRHLGLDTETALRRATHKFERRFRALEATLTARGLDPATLTSAELEVAWHQAKAATAGADPAAPPGTRGDDQ